MLKSATIVHLALSLDVGRVGEFWRGEGTKVLYFAVCLYMRAKAVAKFVCPKKASGLVRGPGTPCVLTVYGIGYVPEVTKPVVILDSVDMVNLKYREGPALIKPREPMRKIQDSINTDHYVATPGNAAGQPLAGYAIASRCAPRKNASLGIVVKQLAQSLRGKIGLSHEAVLSLIGQRPGRVDSACPASLFSRMHTACAMGAE